MNSIKSAEQSLELRICVKLINVAHQTIKAVSPKKAALFFRRFMMQTEPKVKKTLQYKIGMSLIFSSIIFWIIPFGIPFLPLSSKIKVISITSSLVLAEVVFWIGAIMVGKEVAGKIRKYFTPKNWRKKHTEEA